MSQDKNKKPYRKTLVERVNKGVSDADLANELLRRTELTQEDVQHLSFDEIVKLAKTLDAAMTKLGARIYYIPEEGEAEPIPCKVRYRWRLKRGRPPKEAYRYFAKRWKTGKMSKKEALEAAARETYTGPFKWENLHPNDKGDENERARKGVERAAKKLKNS